MKYFLKISAIFSLIFVIQCNEVKSQGYVNFGYNAGFPTGLDSLNFVIDRYNTTRPYLTETMGKINYLDGFTITGGLLFDFFFLEFGYAAGIQRRSAEGIDNTNSLIRRELKVTAHNFDMGFGLSLVDEDKGGVLLGGNVNLGGFLIKTRYAEVELIKDAEWEQINPFDELFFTGGVFIRFFIGNPGFYIQPYYQFSLGTMFNNDMTDVNMNLNHNTYMNDPSPLNTNSNIIGFKIGFTFYSKS